MDRVEVLITIDDDSLVPFYATEGASGADLRAAEAGTLKPLERRLVKTGLRIALPSGYEAQVRPRSGLALKHGITMLNSPGTIDSDYRGEIGVIMINLGGEDFSFSKGDRIAQLVISKYSRADFKKVDSLEDTARSSGGFGHTGKN